MIQNHFVKICYLDNRYNENTNSKRKLDEDIGGNETYRGNVRFIGRDQTDNFVRLKGRCYRICIKTYEEASTQ